MYNLIYEQKDKLIITVTHDLSDEHLKKFDEIILFDQGTIKKQESYHGINRDENLFSEH